MLQGVFAAARDITKRKQAEQQILDLACHDTLTQLPNRRLLDECLGQAMASSKRSGRYGALIFLDMDNFKSLNDTHGHYTGDLLLIEVAHRISSCVREIDVVARFGGDEFVVVLGDLGTDKTESTIQANIVAEKIRIILKNTYELKVETEGKTTKNIEHHCTSSIGVALFLDHEVGTEEVIKWADIAMYQAKEAGGDSIHFYEG
jgi:diguanylate cyclase (GGDEF)-like protein